MAARRRFRWGFAVLGAVLVVLLALVWVLTHQPPKQQHPPGVPVTVARAALADVPVSIGGLGAAQAWKSDLINTQVNGMLTWVAPEGTDVRAGAPLAQIDSGPYRAALTVAEGALRRDEAVLAGARANLARFQMLARAGLDRQAAGRRPDGAGAAGRGHGRARPRPGRRRVDQPALLPYRLADRRARRRAPCGPRQYRLDSDDHGHRQRQPDQPDRRDLHRPAGRLPAPGPGLRRLSPAADHSGVEPGDRRVPRPGRPFDRRQPCGPRDGDGRAEGAVRERRGAPSGQASSSTSA